MSSSRRGSGVRFLHLERGVWNCIGSELVFRLEFSFSC